MKQELDNMVAELCAFDTELAKDPALVRKLIEELRLSKPAVVIDDAFKTNLRALLLNSVPATPAPRRVLPWWLLYTAPLGVAALVFMLVRPAVAPTLYMSPDTLPMAPADSVMQMAPAVQEGSYSSDERVGKMERTMVAPASTAYFTATLSTTSVEVSYLTTAKPSYVVVTDPAGSVVAVSELFAEGEHTAVVFSSLTPFVSNVIYTATLYFDNGDGVFAKDSDEVATDDAGVAITLPLALP